MFTNTRSLTKTEALVEIHADLIACEIDVCQVSETWFSVQNRSESIEFTNYTFQRADRNPTNSAKSSGGGVACYAKTTMDNTKLMVVGSEDFELMWLLSKALKMYLVVVYYLPDETNGQLLLSHLRNSIEKLAVETPGYNFVIGGDINHLEAIKITEKTDCTWIKTSDTRGKKCLDKVFVSNTDLIDQAETIKTSFNTDHLAILLQPKRTLKAKRRKIKLGDYRIQKRQRMNLALDRHVFDALFSVTDPSTATEMLMTAITEKLDEHCQMGLIKVSSKDPSHMSPSLKILLREKDKKHPPGEHTG